MQPTSSTIRSASRDASWRNQKKSLAGTSSSWPPSMSCTSQRNPLGAAGSVTRESPQVVCSRPPYVSFRQRALIRAAGSPRSHVCTSTLGSLCSTTIAERPMLKPVSQYVSPRPLVRLLARLIAR
eukprot:852260-Prymnesium_polylepis.1